MIHIVYGVAVFGSAALLGFLIYLLRAAEAEEKRLIAVISIDERRLSWTYAILRRIAPEHDCLCDACLIEWLEKLNAAKEEMK